MTRVREKQRGVALVALVAMLAIGASWYLVQALGTVNRTASVREHNARVLATAKEALLAWAASNAASTDANPGRLPCAQNWGDLGLDTEGRAGANCISGTTPEIGWLPWKQLGLPKLVDASGEQLWYVVSPGWALPTTGGNTIINSNSEGQVLVDGKAAVAVIIAPGPALSTSTCGGAEARLQSRATFPADFRNYLECENARAPVPAAFVSANSGVPFNDHVVAITAAELLPRIEAAIADRIRREIVPSIRGIYASSTWGTNVSSANPVYPFPAPFGNPGDAASFNGSTGSCSGNACQGLLPLRFGNVPGTTTSLCTTAADGPLCDPLFVSWTGGTIEVKSVTVTVLGIPITYVPGLIPLTSMTWGAPPAPCTVTTAGTPAQSRLQCTAHVPGLAGVLSSNVIYEVRGIAGNVAMAMRQFDALASMPGVTVTTTPTVAMNSDGSATMTFRGRTTAPSGGSLVSTLSCGLGGILAAGIECRPAEISVPLSMFPDHPLLNVNSATHGWFFRNEWYRLLYYATAYGQTAAALPGTPSCSAGANCLVVANEASPNDDKRAIFMLAGRSLGGMARPNGEFADFLDTAANRDLNAQFEKVSVNRISNDRIIIIDEY